MDCHVEVETSVFLSERFFVPIHRDQNDNGTMLFGHPHDKLGDSTKNL